MTEIEYRTGDACTVPTEPTILAQVCNDQGAWGRGFVLAVSTHWPEPEIAYKSWYTNQNDPYNPDSLFVIGGVQFVPVTTTLTIANMIAQRGLRSFRNPHPLSYSALDTCLRKVGERAVSAGTCVQMPKIGTGLAGGDWDEVALLVERRICSLGVPVLVYEPPG